LIRFAAQTRSASKAIFAAIAASIFRLVLVVIIRSVYHDRTALFQLRPWSHSRGQLTPPQAKLSREEPNAENLHVRVCEGRGQQRSHLLGRRDTLGEDLLSPQTF
jgi:hypothetical protein